MGLFCPHEYRGPDWEAWWYPQIRVAGSLRLKQPTHRTSLCTAHPTSAPHYQRLTAATLAMTKLWRKKQWLKCKRYILYDRVSIRTAVSIAEMLEHGRDARIIRVQLLRKRFSLIKQTTRNRDEQCKFWKTQKPQKIETKNTTGQSAHDRFIDRLKSAEKRVSELQKSKDKKKILNVTECNFQERWDNYKRSKQTWWECQEK